MAYNKTTWQNGQAPHINAANLNKIEQGIYDNSVDIEGLETNAGDITELETTDKSSLVGAINEINEGAQKALETATYKTTSGSAEYTSTTGATKDVCSVTLDEGIYLILGGCDSTVSNTAQSVITTITSADTVTWLAGLTAYRTPMTSGGGVSGWRIVSVPTGGATIKLQTYAAIACTIRGQLSAIKLQTTE